MTFYLLRRLLSTVVTLWLLMTTVFILFVILPGSSGRKGPAGISPVAVLLAGRSPSMEKLQQIQQDLGLDDPIPTQYVRFLKNLATLDFGYSYQYEGDIPVWPLVKSSFWPTVQLTIGTSLIAFMFGVAGGVLSTRQARSWVDRSMMGTTLVLMAIPAFVLGSLGLYAFAKIGIHVRSSYVPPTESLTQWLRAMAIPWLALALPLAGIYARLVRSSMKEVQQDEYITAAYARGLTDRRVLFLQLRSSVAPVITLLSLHMATIVSTTIIIEKIFEIPGMGFLISQTTYVGDFPVIAAVTFVGGVLVLAMSLLMDLAYRLLDPRIATN